MIFVVQFLIKVYAADILSHQLYIVFFSIFSMFSLLIIILYLHLCDFFSLSFYTYINILNCFYSISYCRNIYKCNC